MDSNLLQRCRELINLSETGILKIDGEVRKLAASKNYEKFPPSQRLNIAMESTRREAIAFVVKYDELRGAKTVASYHVDDNAS